MLDDRIDETARELTSGEPGRDLRARVLARIEERPADAGHHDWTGRYNWRWTSAAVAAGIAIVILAYRVDRPVPATEPALVAGRDIPLEAAPEIPEGRQMPGAASEASALTKLANADSDLMVDLRSQSTEAAPAEGFDSVGPEPLALAGIDVVLLEPVEPIAIEPLSIEPIRILPLEGGSTQELR